jgi:hypothetical protein
MELNEMRRFEFTITLAGYGKDADMAWIDACENFSLDWGTTPTEYKETGEILE